MGQVLPGNQKEDDEMKEFTHFDESGRSRMVDVSDKAPTLREATATATVTMQPETLHKILNREFAKGDVLGVAQVAGIMAAKRTGDLIPMCHPLNLTSVSMEFYPRPEQHSIEIRATARICDRTGIEMEALTAVSVAALTVYDMCKAVDRGMIVSDVCLLRKSGGRSGTFERASNAAISENSQ